MIEYIAMSAAGIAVGITGVVFARRSVKSLPSDPRIVSPHDCEWRWMMGAGIPHKHWNSDRCIVCRTWRRHKAGTPTVAHWELEALK